MSAHNEPAVNWFKVPIHFWMDEEFLALSAQAQMLFLKIVALCAGAHTRGRVTGRQIQMLYADMSNGARVAGSLVTQGALILTPDLSRSGTGDDAGVSRGGGDGEATVSRAGTAGEAGRFSPSAVYRIASAKKWLFLNDRDRSVEPSQPAKSIEDGQRGQPRARTGGPARGEKERERERTKSSPAPPDGLDLVARAAPRLGGAESRPAPVQDPRAVPKPNQDQQRVPVDDPPDDPDSLKGLEHLKGPALAKEALRLAIANGSRPIRQPVKLFKYPREIYPVLPNEGTVDYGEAQ